MHEHDQANTGSPQAPCPSAKRNRYFKGKNMAAGDFSLEQHYGISRRRLLNRAIHGWGVAYGFALGIGESGELCCGPGLALDRHGRELFRPSAGLVPSGEIYLPHRGCESTGQTSEDGGKGAARYLLQAHYAERPVDAVNLNDACGCPEREWNHVCETLVFSLKPLCGDEGCACSEPACPVCGCGTDGCGRDGQHLDRGPHQRLCDWLTGRDFPGAVADLCHWNGFDAALNDPVPLACVTVAVDKCGHPLFQSIDDACTPRRLVKTNDLLFDLIRGCDLTHISEVSWAGWHRLAEPVPWREFRAMFPCKEEGEKTKPQGKHPGGHSVSTRFWFKFSCPVQTTTLTPECFAMTALVTEERTGWITALRVPVTELVPDPPLEGDPEGTTRGAIVNVNADWCDDEICDRTTVFRHGVASVEIEIRGDLILDCGGQAVDANTRGLSAAPTGNGSPGGTYFSAFRVSHRPEGSNAS